MISVREISQELEAGRYYCDCCRLPGLLIRRVGGTGELLASCLNSGKLYRADNAGNFTLIENNNNADFEGGRRPSLAPMTVIDLSRESYS